MSNGDELTGTGAERFAAHVGNAVFGDDIINVVFAGGDNCAGLKNGLDSADGAVLCSGGESNETFTTLGETGAADIVNLAAGT